MKRNKKKEENKEIKKSLKVFTKDCKVRLPIFILKGDSPFLEIDEMYLNFN